MTSDSAQASRDRLERMAKDIVRLRNRIQPMLTVTTPVAATLPALPLALKLLAGPAHTLRGWLRVRGVARLRVERQR